VNVLVVPTNSADRLIDFLHAWSPWPWDRVIVVYDAQTASFTLPQPLRDQAEDRLELYSWAEIDELAPDPTIFSRQDSAIRSFGFWRSWLAGAEIILTLDDDCYPAGEDLVAAHRDNLYRTRAWTSSVPGMRVRGMPYRNTGVLTDVHVSVGLWRGIPDLDAVCTLAGPQHPPIDGVQTRVMPSRQFFPMSGMNLAFRRDVACLMYFPPMGVGQPFARFDDIWCGLLLQRICRHLGYSIVCGRPFIDHRRASDPFVNLVKEAPGVAVHEKLWEAIDQLPLTATRPLDCMAEAGRWLADVDDEYLSSWGRAIGGWCQLFTAPGERPPSGRLAAAQSRDGFVKRSVKITE
jgi:reversibly glycosylated polypeptide / UDP-arabinopyranose mutase